jgi:hypothetical protein
MNAEFIRKNLSVYAELEITNGFASSIVELDSNDVGSFVFRGLDLTVALMIKDVQN